MSVFLSPLAVFYTYSGDITTARAEADEALRLARQVGQSLRVGGGPVGVWARP